VPVELVGQQKGLHLGTVGAEQRFESDLNGIGGIGHEVGGSGGRYAPRAARAVQQGAIVRLAEFRMNISCAAGRAGVA
jgi:hypothetical protein